MGEEKKEKKKNEDIYATINDVGIFNSSFSKTRSMNDILAHISNESLSHIITLNTTVVSELK